jgi:hypothetical protein
MAQFWTDQYGQEWEMKTEDGKDYYRRRAVKIKNPNYSQRAGRHELFEGRSKM